MRYDLGALQAKLLEQGLVLEGIRLVAAGAEERQKSFHADLLTMTAVLLNTKRERTQATVGGSPFGPFISVARGHSRE